MVGSVMARTAKSGEEPGLRSANRSNNLESKQQRQSLDLANFRVNRAHLLRGLHRDVQRQCDVPATGRGADRVVEVRSRGQMGADSFDHSGFESIVRPADRLDLVDSWK